MKAITGIILAGGKSSRMGTDKGLLDLNGKKIVEHIIEQLKPNVGELIIIANNKNYDGFSFQVYQDLVEPCGPMGGIYTALEKSLTENNIVVSCDIPNITSKIIAHIISNIGDEAVLVPVHNGNIEPLCAVYKKSIAKKIKNLIETGEYKLKDALKTLNTRYIDVSSSSGFSESVFTNINTPQELEARRVK
jgi:molybdenum cofactor guanylyltransferase